MGMKFALAEAQKIVATSAGDQRLGQTVLGTSPKHHVPT